MRLFHGTSADCAKEIIANGFSIDKGGANWDVSGRNVYFWSPDQLKETERLDDDDNGHEEAKRRALDSSYFSLAFAKDCRIVIFEVELDETEFDICEDDSCENMEGAVYTHLDVPASKIVRAYVSENLSLVQGFFLSFCMGRDMCARELSPLQTKVAELFAKADVYPDEDWFDVREISLDELNKTL